MRYSYGPGKVTTQFASNKEKTIRDIDSLPIELKDNILKSASATAKYRQYLAQRFVDVICERLKIKTVKVRVYEKPRPTSNNPDGSYCQTEGQYRYAGANEPRLLEIWNKTAFKKSSVSNKMFYEALIHEFIHHYDICKLWFETTPHTKGFFKRIEVLDSLFGKGAG